MRDFCKVSPLVWRSQKFKNLSAGAQLVYLYLLTCHHSNSIGCFMIHPDYIGADIPALGGEAEIKFLEVKKSGLIDWDHDEQLVLVHNFITFNPPTNSKHATKMVSEALQLGNARMRIGVIETIGRIVGEKGWKDVHILKNRAAQAYPEGQNTLFDSLPDTLSDRVSPQDTHPNQTLTETPTPTDASADASGVLTSSEEGVGGSSFKPISSALPSNSGYDVLQHIRDTTYEAAKRNAPGWDFQNLIRIYNEGIRNGERTPAINANLAFPAWVLKYTKGKPPA